MSDKNVKEKDIHEYTNSKGREKMRTTICTHINEKTFVQILVCVTGKFRTKEEVVKTLDSLNAVKIGRTRWLDRSTATQYFYTNYKTFIDNQGIESLSQLISRAQDYCGQYLIDGLVA